MTAHVGATLEQRVTDLEGEARRLRADMSAADERVENAAREHAVGLVEDTAADGRADVEGVRHLLLQVTKPTRRAWWSLGLVAAGLILQTAANVVSVT